MMTGNITLDLTDSSGRVMRLPLGISPNNIEPPEEPIKCTPSSLNIPVYPVATGVLPVFRYLNVSKNDNPVDWFEFDESNPDISPSEQMQNLANYLFTAEDGQSVAFVDITSFGETPVLDTSTGLLALPVSGLSGNNVTLDGIAYDLYQTGLGIGNQQYEVTDLIEETTTIKIFPMPDVLPEEDGYVVMGGNGTDPLVFTSCSKAVLQPKAGEDVPVNCSVSIEENSGYEDGGLFYLRINGEYIGQLPTNDPSMPFYFSTTPDSIKFDAKEDRFIDISLTPFDGQKNDSTRFKEGIGTIAPDGTFNFRLNKSSACDITPPPIKCIPDAYSNEILNTSNTVTKNIYYKHKGKLKQETVKISPTISGVDVFLGRSLPSDITTNEEMGCVVLSLLFSYDNNFIIAIDGLDSNGKFNNGFMDSVDILLDLHPYLTRPEVTVDVTSNTIEIISAAEAGVLNDENDIYPLLDTTVFNSCSQLTIPKPDGDGSSPGGCAKRYTYVLRLGIGGPFEVNHPCEVGDYRASGIVEKLHNVCARIAFEDSTAENPLMFTHLITYKQVEETGTSYIVNELTREINSEEVGVHADMLLAGASYVEQYNHRDYIIVFNATYADGSKLDMGGIRIRTSTDGTPITTDDLPACQVPD